MSKKDYDVIVVGAGISGLSTAALLVKAGYGVIVLEQGESAGGLCSEIESDGYKFDLGANLLWGIQDKGSINYLLRKIGLFDLYKNDYLKKLEVPFQIVMPDHRLNIYSKRVRLYEELKREFPGSFESLKSLYVKSDKADDEIYDRDTDIYPYMFTGKKGLFNTNLKSLRTSDEIKNILRSTLDNKKLEKFIDLQTGYFGQSGFFDSSTVLSSIVLGLSKRGMYSIKGGSHTIISSLVNFIKRNGGTFMLGAEVSEIIVKKRRAIGVRVNYEGVSSEIFSKCVVTSTDFSSLKNLIKNKRSENIYNKFIDGINKEFVPFTVFLGVDEKVIPEPMNENVFLVRDYNLPSFNDNFIYISISSLDNKESVPLKKRIISATIFLDRAESANIDSEYTKRKTDEVIVYLEQVIPFLRKYISKVLVVDPFKYQEITKRELGSFGMTYGKNSNVNGFSALKNNSPFKSFLFTGDSVFPGHGLAGAVRSGINVANLII